MNADQFRRLALSLPQALEASHMGHPDFRVGGKIFATLGYPDMGHGMVKLTPEEQELLVQMEPEVFAQVQGGWGRGGATLVRLRAAKPASLRNALAAAWRNTAPKSLVRQLDSAARPPVAPRPPRKAMRFADEILAAIRQSPSLGVRAGLEPRKFTRIWVVVVDGRVFVRSWSLKPRSWYRTFLKQPRGAVQIGRRELAVRALPVETKRLRDAIDHAYLEKYDTPAMLKYARDLGQPKSRATTTELVPL